MGLKDELKGGTAAHGMASADHGPIEPEFHDQMNKLASLVDAFFNGADCKPDDKKVGFFLTCFNFGEHEHKQGRFNYISNADKLDVRATLKEITARIEGRMMAENTNQKGN